MKKCPKCLIEYPDDSNKLCVKCGIKLKKPLSKRMVILLVIFGILVIIGSSMPQPELAYYDACLAAQGFVKDHLKAPSTAKFPSINHLRDDDYIVTKLGEGSYKVSSYVDAENSFGANMRTDYTVIVKDVGDKWKLEDIDIENR